MPCVWTDEEDALPLPTLLGEYGPVLPVLLERQLTTTLELRTLGRTKEAEAGTNGETPA